MRVVVLPYDPAWSSHFQRIRSQLLEILSDVPVVSIEHVGSTSIPGLSAKPMIDIDIIVEPKYIPAAASALSFGGYVFNPEPRGIDRLSFRYKAHLPHSQGASEPTPDGDIRRMVYLNMPGGVALQNHRAVKKVLLRDPELVKEYSDVKVKLAEGEHESIGHYGNAKGAILAKILEKGKEDLTDEARNEIEAFNKPWASK